MGIDTHEADVVRTECDAVDVVEHGLTDSSPDGGVLGVQPLDVGLHLDDGLMVVLADGVAYTVGRLGAEGVPHQVHLVLSLLADVVEGVLEASHVGDSGNLAVALGAQKPAVW